MSEHWRMGATELAARIRAGEVTSREVVRAHLERIEAVNPTLNALTVVLAEQALAAADAADRALRDGGPLGPLHGVPFTVKENLDVAGTATTFGLAMLREAIVEEDSPVVAALRGAGAIPIGRSNMPEFGVRWHTDNGLAGATRNPWSAAHTPGGSSGGEAAAIAAGLSPLGIGNDGAGSLRWPAQCCGVAALKPSFARVPIVSPARMPLQPIPFAFQLLGVNGPMARRVADLRLALEPMCAASVGDPWHVPAPVTGAALSAPIGVALVEDPGGGVDADVALGVRRAGQALADAGYRIETRLPPQLERAAEIYTQIMTRFGRTTEQPPSTAGMVSEPFERFWRSWGPIWNEACGNPTYDPMAERAALVHAWAVWMQSTPLIVAPIVARPAFRLECEHDPSWLAGWPGALRMAVAINLLGLPAVAVPVGVAGGLPQAVQVIGPRFREDLCLEAAQAIEDRCPMATPIDPC